MCRNVSLLIIKKKRVTHPHGQATHQIIYMNYKCDTAAAAHIQIQTLITWNLNIKNITNISISFVSGQIIKVV